MDPGSAHGGRLGTLRKGHDRTVRLAVRRRRHRVSVFAFALLAAAGALLGTSPRAWAHGAGFGPRPPNYQPPDTAPTPPPPPGPPAGLPAPPPAPTPPAQPPPQTAPPATGGSSPGVGPAPRGPSIGGPTTGRGRTGGRPGPSAPDLESAWQTWWLLNRAALLPDRLAALDARVVTPREGDLPPEDAWEVRREEAVRGVVLPFLLRLLDPKRDVRDDVRASALIAAAKVAPDRLVRRLILCWLEDARAAPLVRESAALAAGLLRRTRPDQQMDGAELDRLRERLLAAYDDDGAPRRMRAFALLALGVLADQPYGNAWTKDGRLVVRELRARLTADDLPEDMTVALIVALGRQPDEGVPDAVRSDLKDVALGKRRRGRRWNSVERSHALMARIRLGGPGTPALLRRVLEQKRQPKEVRRAAFTALAEITPCLAEEERRETAAALDKGMRYAKDPLGEGLGYIAAGMLLGADLAAGKTDVLEEGHLPRLLLSEARSGQVAVRGFAALGLALATRNVPLTSRATTRFRADATRLLRDGLEKGRGDDRLLGAYAAGLGLVGDESAIDLLLGVIEDRGRDSELRGHCAVALGQLGRGRLDVRRALDIALVDRRRDDLCREAALGLALLGGRTTGAELLRELGTARTERTLGQVVIALGWLGDLGAVPGLVQKASDEGRSELAQALAVAALGRLADPERRPSLLRLTENANYPARTDALHEAYTIL